MDWTNRGPSANQPANQTAPVNKSDSFNANPTPKKKGRGIGGKFGDLRIAMGFLLISVAILLLALVGYLVLFEDKAGEEKYVNKDKLQAVFLNGGQVYFGRVNELNKNYLQLSDIYYLRVNQQVQPGQEGAQGQEDISLVKLGCELHGPEDSMVINREQVIFWENLKDDGQVTKAVVEYIKQNPDGQKCETDQQPANESGNAEQQNNEGQQQAQPPATVPNNGEATPSNP
ncbi:hypothetical protein BH23PAT1_BH23PAT1_0750 [soil metagenome]